MTNLPFFKHDCQKCDYLGSITFPARYINKEGNEYTKPQKADPYCCGSEKSLEGKSIIARFSSEGSSYASSPTQIIRSHYFSNSLATATPALIAGYWFSVSKGLVRHK
jgi:hypothetical protein